MSQQLGLFETPPVPAVQPVRPAERPITKSGGRPEVRYRNPAALHQAWTGRGKPPRWIIQWIESGKSLEALLVQGARP